MTMLGGPMCYLWNRNHNGCSMTGICEAAYTRSHACEWCLAPHRAIDCPDHLGKKPWEQSQVEQQKAAHEITGGAPKGKSKGKGKGKYGFDRKRKASWRT